MTEPESAGKSAGARRHIPGKPFQKGVDPRRGRGPQPGAGNAGPTPVAYASWCREVLSNPKVADAIKAVITNPDHPHFVSLWAKLCDRGFGRVVEQGEDGQAKPLMIYVVRESGTVVLRGDPARPQLPSGNGDAPPGEAT